MTVRRHIRLSFGKLRISPSALAALFAMLLADPSACTLAALLAATVHECGHVAALRACGAHIDSITVLPFGAMIRSDVSRLPYKKEALAALAGPLAGLAAALVSGLVCFRLHDRYSLFFAACNLTLAGINLIPVHSLDGGRAAEALLLSCLPFEKAQALSDAVNGVSLAVLTLAAIGLVLLGSCNFSLILFCISLFLIPDDSGTYTATVSKAPRNRKYNDRRRP